MPRRALILILALVAALAATAPASAALTRARVVDCSPGFAVFEGEMRGIRGANRLQMRFTLQARTPGEGHWRRVAAPGFGVWKSSDPGVGGYVYTKRVEHLVAPAAYRALVRFRWISPTGAVVLRATRRTGVCQQREERRVGTVPPTT